MTHRAARIHAHPGHRAEQIDRAKHHESRVPFVRDRHLGGHSGLNIPPMAPAEFIHSRDKLIQRDFQLPKSLFQVEDERRKLLPVEVEGIGIAEDVPEAEII